MEDFNLHLTGDIHAVVDGPQPAGRLHRQPHLTTATRSTSTRSASPGRGCIDINDRALRNIVVGLGGTRQRLPARDRLRHRRRLRSHGDPRADHRPQGPAPAAGPDRHRRTPRTASRSPPRTCKCAGRDGRAAEGRDQAEPDADAGAHAGASCTPGRSPTSPTATTPSSPTRSPQARRLRGHRERLRRRHGRWRSSWTSSAATAA